MNGAGEPWTTIDRFLAGEITPDELAGSLRAIPALELRVGPDDARRLRALGETSDAALASTLALDLYERHRPGQLAADRAGRLARGIADGTISAPAGARALSRLRAGGNPWIPEAFTGIAAALDAAPAAGAHTLRARLNGERARSANLRPAIIVAARRLIELLDSRAAV